ncbi:MAG TPA: hypothetical protein VKQ32_23300 [Polyangia bacterium]|nr:hypothetical protein [Polyangia bacterium]
MSSERPLPPDVDALLDHEREIPPLPASVRARALARARAALVAGAATRAAMPTPVPRTRWAAVAALICVGGATVGAAAYEIRVHLAPPIIQPVVAPVQPIAKPPVAPGPPAPAAEELPAPPPDADRPVLSKADAARAELHLLRQARAAVAREAYAAALAPIAEHARRFKDGRLAEEREALRVKALAGLGRTEEARRAAKAFRARFPRSVLLPAVSQMPASEP